jgi:hypothetical protein
MSVDDVDWVSASKPTQRYNCFGFAVQKIREAGKLRWWQPPDIVDGVVRNPTAKWPKGVPKDTTINSYVEAAKTEDFFVSVDGAWEEGFETIVLYFDSNGEFQHAARQKTPGVWESKLGSWSDIEHSFNGIDNIRWGDGRIFMKRTWPFVSPLSSRISE